jgi:hypothetical protein
MAMQLQPIKILAFFRTPAIGGSFITKAKIIHFADAARLTQWATSEVCSSLTVTRLPLMTRASIDRRW